MALRGHNRGLRDGGVGLVGDVVPPRLGISRFYHDSLSCWFFYFASSLSITANLSQTNFPIIKTKHFNVTTYKKRYGRYLGQSG